MSEQFALCDRRRLEFRAEALAAALEALGSNVLGLPPGRPETVTLLPARSTIEVTYPGTAPQPIEITATALTAVLIGYCAGIQTPMPRSAEKSLVISAEHVALNMVLRFRQPPRMSRVVRLGNDRGREPGLVAGSSWPR
jgi:hypothetical protein